MINKPLPLYQPLIALLIGALPIGHWYARRMTDGSDEPWGLLAMAATLIFVPWKRLRQPAPKESLVLVCACLLALACTRNHLPIIIRATLPALTVGWLLYRGGAPFAVHGLLLISLPWIATLQFYLGYPLRILTGESSVRILHILRYQVERIGTIMNWQGLQVVVDQPCAGIAMLWFGAFLTYLLACLHHFDWKQCLLLNATSALAILGANILRNCLLFFMETGIWQLPHWSHEGIGWLGFMIVAGALLQRSQSWKKA